MNLLPKSEVKFAEKAYWDSFFKNRDKEFEWYGEYPELCSQLHKYIKSKDNILVVGCGNSKLSANLYDVGCRSIVNIDVSNIVIKQMRHLHRERTGMRYEVMDALDTSFTNDQFSVVLDKGTLDALMPQDVPEDIERGQGLLTEVSRVLKLGGRYVVISLLQPHILRTLLEVFTAMGWMIRICRCNEVEERTLHELGQLRLPVFMVICTKFRNVGKSVLEMSNGGGAKPMRIETVEEVMKALKEVQGATAMCSAIQKQALEEEVELEFQRDGDSSPRYSIRVVDRDINAARIRTYGALIVPHGRETEWMFGTPAGRKLLRKSSGFDRLAVISLHRDHIYPSLEEIQHELGGSVAQLSPLGAPAHIPYVTVGDGLGQRDLVYSGKSEISGDFVVEDVVVDADRFRRLIFLNNQSVIQSEAKLKQVRKGTKCRWRVDPTHMACSYHSYLALGVNLLNAPACNILILGLGGGGLCLFLRRLFPEAIITAVDIDPAIVDVAKSLFGVNPDSQLKLEIDDGLCYLAKCSEKGIKYDIVVVDVDCKTEGTAMTCPPPQFVESSTLQLAKSIITEFGIFVVNMVCRVEAEKERVVNTLRKNFELTARFSLEEDVNEILFASSRKDLSPQQWREEIEKAAKSLNIDSKKNLSPKEDLLNLCHLLETLCVQ